MTATGLKFATTLLRQAVTGLGYIAAPHPNLSLESKTPTRFLCHHPPVDVLLRMALLDVVFEGRSRCEVPSTEVTTMVALRYHTNSLVAGLL